MFTCHAVDGVIFGIFEDCIWGHLGHLAHSPPVKLSALTPGSELKAGHLEEVEEAEAHHIGDGIIYTLEALAKPLVTVTV